ncbi:MAG: NAD-dependent epimerase/dehydratase family protein, partial [Cyanobacteriota bacterium]
MSVLITGVAGFIGAAVAQRLLARGESVVGVDNLNPYYDPALKRARLRRLEVQAAASGANWRFQPLDIADGAVLAALFTAVRPRRVVHLAAQAGVRYSLENPAAYVQSNLVGMAHVLEGCRQQQVEHLVYASSSSVYGGNRN